MTDLKTALEEGTATDNDVLAGLGFIIESDYAWGITEKRVCME